MKKLFVLFFISILVVSYSVSEIGNDWIGFYYPDINNIGDESSWVIQPGLL